ncbi:outer membrane protein assembly factor BamB [Candidatus Nitrotoga sp. M5]|uniref:outer membrane protein assembly factor BamB n=1 Tax=Candidatus Nitrotoga sp. M5 TaxID=2890409 RepID=UPI001EF2E219|nr:outer membrane protein assembly factor BamB [Candidatus Nitrotoga sp. M5]CAH1386735.1 Outer membrane protein assembly factor BamB [Candidatus Nitrotoga sp. M5]
MIIRTAALLLLAMLAGCSTVSGWFSSEKTGKEPAELVEFKQAATFDVRWHQKIGESENYVLQPAVTSDAVYAANAEGELFRLDPVTGKQVWRVDSGFTISAGVGVGEGLVLVGGGKGQLAAFAADGKSLWTTKVSSEVLNVAPVVDGIVVVRTADGRLSGIDATDGSRLWQYEHAVPSLIVRSHAGVAVERGTVFAGLPAGKLTAISLSSGIVIWETVVSLPRGNTELERISDITSSPVLDDEQVCAVAFQGRVACYSLSQGSLLWSRDLSSDKGIQLFHNYLYSTNTSGAVLAMDKSSGSSVWKNDQLFMRQPTVPQVYGDNLVVGDYEGYLHALSREDGSMVARLKTDGSAMLTAPMKFDGGLLVQTQDGGLYSVILH